MVTELKGKRVTPNWPHQYSEEGLPSDAFDLWKLHYQEYKQADAANRMKDIQHAFETYIYKGLPSIGVRMLDHGVCSGLLLLLSTTCYYELFYGAKRIIAKKEEDKRVLEKFLNRMTDYDYDPVFWWTGIVWATAATAMHNIQQMHKPWTATSVSDSLALEEEPLAFLGVLVDCLQEWDRYYVFPTPGKLPLQAVEVGLESKDDIVILDFHKTLTAEKIREALSRSLKDWDRFVSVLPLS